MHRSRLQAVVVDCEDLETGVRFWTQALGLEVRARSAPYVSLGLVGELKFLLQEVPEPKTTKSRIHLDIESDDVEAEVARLEERGARRIERIEDWWVMTDPCGNEFCVVPVKIEELERRPSNVWGA